MTSAGASRAAKGGRLAIIAGGGTLPHHVAEAVRARGEDPFVIALSREAEESDWLEFTTPFSLSVISPQLAVPFGMKASIVSCFRVGFAGGRNGAIFAQR